LDALQKKEKTIGRSVFLQHVPTFKDWMIFRKVQKASEDVKQNDTISKA
jgi:hypothetical protein